MDGAQLSVYPHASWLHFRVGAPPDDRPLVVHMRSVAHSVSLTVRGHHAVRAICRGAETQWTEQAGAVHFLPADDEDRVFVTRRSPDCESAVFLIPRGHLRGCLDPEGVDAPAEFRRMLLEDDPILRACMARLASTADGSEPAAADESARRLVLRLAECWGETARLA